MTEEDIENLQTNLDKLFNWENQNNMKFNGSKVQVVSYGPNEGVKDGTMYFTTNMEDIIEHHSS